MEKSGGAVHSMVAGLEEEVGFFGPGKFSCAVACYHVKE